MSYPQNPPAHPEIGPRNSVKPVDNRTTETSGVIIFNKCPLPTSDLLAPLEEAPAQGDTIEKRLQALSEALLLSEQK